MKKILFSVVCFLLLYLACFPAMAQVALPVTNKQYHEQINKLWNQKKAQYTEAIKKSKDNPQVLYNIQGETNNLLKYAGYCKKHELIDELSGLYLQSLDTLTMTDQYLYAYYPGSPRRSIHPLDKKYRMWVDKQQPVGQEIILDSSQFLYLLSDTVSIIADINREKRTPIMKEALNKFIPLLIEHYDRWIFNTPGPFQVRGWGCRFDGKHVPTGLNHFEFINKKMDKKLGNGKSPAYCNAVQDIDMWIIAGVANVLSAYKKEKALVPITPDGYRKLLDYVKTGDKLIENRFSYTKLKNFDGAPVVGAVFEPGVWDDHPGYDYAGYNEEAYPTDLQARRLKYRAKGAGWDLSHARRFVHVFETLLKTKDVLDLDFPTEELMVKMTNQLVYCTFNRDFKKPLFTNFMDGTNGWYRVGYSGRTGFGYGPWDMSLYVFEGGYGFWSKYNNDIEKVFNTAVEMFKSKDPEIRKHLIDHYEMNYWIQYQRKSGRDFKTGKNPATQVFLMHFLPSLCFMNEVQKNIQSRQFWTEEAMK